MTTCRELGADCLEALILILSDEDITTEVPSWIVDTAECGLECASC